MTTPAGESVVPLIDLAPIDAGTEERRNLARRIGDACATSGFFAVTGHGVAESTVAEMYAASRAIFALPDAEKRRLESGPGDPLRRGLNRSGSLAVTNDDQSRLGRIIEGPDTPPAATPDWCEDFSISVASADGSRPRGHPLASPNRRPRETWIVDAWSAYAAALSALAQRLMALFALALDLPEDWFAGKIDAEMSSLTAIHYPPQPTPPAPGQLRKGAHTDWGSLTLLYQDGAPGGLQVLGPDGAWHDVPAVAGAFVVNIGDLMSRWTNDRWPSTAHRVVNPPRTRADTERYSIAYFHQPNFDAIVSCIPSCLDAGDQPRHEPVTSGSYLLSKVARMYAS